jgi:hypothetical protein
MPRRSTIGTNPLVEPAPEPASEASNPSQSNAAPAERVFAAWAAGIQATLEAMFDAQNNVLRASLVSLEASARAEGRLAERWTAAAQEVQQATLDAFRTRLSVVAQTDAPPESQSPVP